MRLELFNDGMLGVRVEEEFNWVWLFLALKIEKKFQILVSIIEKYHVKNREWRDAVFLCLVESLTMHYFFAIFTGRTREIIGDLKIQNSPPGLGSR